MIRMRRLLIVLLTLVIGFNLTVITSAAVTPYTNDVTQEAAVHGLPTPSIVQLNVSSNTVSLTADEMDTTIDNNLRAYIELFNGDGNLMEIVDVKVWDPHDVTAVFRTPLKEKYYVVATFTNNGITSNGDSLGVKMPNSGLGEAPGGDTGNNGFNPDGIPGGNNGNNGGGNGNGNNNGNNGNNGGDDGVIIQRPDGSIEYPDGTIHKPDGTIERPDGTIQKPDGSIQLPDGTIQKPDGSVQLPDGTIKYPDGSIELPGGAIIHPDGSITYPDGTIIKPDGTGELPNGGTIDKDGSMKLPDGTVVNPDGSVTYPDGTTITKDGDIIYKDGTVLTKDGTLIYLDGTQVLRDGTVIHPNGTVEYLGEGSTVYVDKWRTEYKYVDGAKKRIEGPDGSYWEVDDNGQWHWVAGKDGSQPGSALNTNSNSNAYTLYGNEDGGLSATLMQNNDSATADYKPLPGADETMFRSKDWLRESLSDLAYGGVLEAPPELLELEAAESEKIIVENTITEWAGSVKDKYIEDYGQIGGTLLYYMPLILLLLFICTVLIIRQRNAALRKEVAGLKARAVVTTDVADDEDTAAGGLIPPTWESHDDVASFFNEFTPPDNDSVGSDTEINNDNK